MRTIDALTIEDEKSFRHVALYADLKEILRKRAYHFRVLPVGLTDRWDRALLLNLTFWDASTGGDVLAGERIDADVVTHVGWHHLAAAAFPTGGERPSADALVLGEAIASAFDVFLVGRLLGHASKSSFLETQVPAMADAASAAGLSERAFESLLESIADDPDRAFEDLRALLFDATMALIACDGPERGLAALGEFDAHRFAPLLHRYELSTWVLFARAHARSPFVPDPRVTAVDRFMRNAAVSLDWLVSEWVTPALR